MNNTPLVLLKKLDHISTFISKMGIYVSSALIVFITVIIFVNIILRSFFQYNLPFAEEWASLALVPISYLGLGYTLRKDKHISADVVIRTLSEKVRCICLLFVSIVAFIIITFYVEQAWEVFSYHFQRNITTNGIMRTPLWIASITIFIGLVIFLTDIFFWVLHFMLKLCNKKGLNFG